MVSVNNSLNLFSDDDENKEFNLSTLLFQRALDIFSVLSNDRVIDISWYIDRLDKKYRDMYFEFIELWYSKENSLEQVVFQIEIDQIITDEIKDTITMCLRNNTHPSEIYLQVKAQFKINSILKDSNDRNIDKIVFGMIGANFTPLEILSKILLYLYISDLKESWNESDLLRLDINKINWDITLISIEKSDLIDDFTEFIRLFFDS